MELKVAENIEEFLIHCTEAKKNGNFWFRGQRYSNYRLEPALFRNKYDISINEPYYKRELYLVKDDAFGREKFKNYLLNYQDCSDLNEIDYLFLMQHYGIPTRLLDFSKNELIALYFSVSKDTISNVDTPEEINQFYFNEGFTEKGSAVVCINPFLINKESFGKESIIDLNEYKFSSLRNIDFPICINVNGIDKRINVQEAVFVYFGTMVTALDYYSIFRESITKIFIPNSKRKEIKEELKKEYKITHSTMYPDLSGIAMEIIDEMNEEFSQRKNMKDKK